MVIVSAWLDYFPNRLSDVKLRYSYFFASTCPHCTTCCFFLIQKGEITGAPLWVCVPANGLLFSALLLADTCQRFSQYLNSIPGDSLCSKCCFHHSHSAPLHSLPQQHRILQLCHHWSGICNSALA